MQKNYGRTLLLRVGIIAISIGACAVAIVIFSHRLKGEVGLVTQARALNLQTTRTSELLASLKSDRQKAGVILATLNRYLPNEYELFKFNDWAERAGRTQGVVVTPSVQIATLYLLSGPLGYAPIGLSVTGNPNAVFSYLKFMEGNNGQYFVILDSVDVTNSGNASGTMTTTAQGKLLFKKQ